MSWHTFAFKSVNNIKPYIMSRFKLFSLPLIALLIIALQGNAQPYNTGIGLRLGGIAYGITVKHFTGSNSAIEGIVGFRSHALFVTGLFEWHHPFPNAEGLSWYYGGGAHIGFFEDRYHYGHFYHKHHKHDFDFDHDEADISFGGDFILGLDYKFRNAPVNLSLDVKPMIDLVPGFYGYWEGALSLRFTL